jgi:hypothetical protein
MRLSNAEINSIRTCAVSVFAELGYRIWLFGSRTDDAKRGGDIDLLVEVNTDADRLEITNRELAFLVTLKGEIGEQKIDIIVATSAAVAADPFLQSVVPNRILLASNS